jgi:hypothetical protein
MKTGASFLLSAGITAALVAGALVFGAAGIGWLVGSPVLAGALAMIMSGTLIFGFGGIHISGWMAIIVIITWFFTDKLMHLLGISTIAGYITLAVVYLVVGMYKGLTQHETVMSGAGPMLAIVLGAIISAIFFPGQAAQSVEEALISAAVISGARTVRQAIEKSESLRHRHEEQDIINEQGHTPRAARRKNKRGS